MQSDHSTFLETLRSRSHVYGVKLNEEVISRIDGYYRVLEDWNPRLHLVAPCPPQEFATRHILESLYLLKHLPVKATVLDVGSGGGLPIVPCLAVRPDLKATLIESSKRKSVFLREALKQIHIDDAKVLAERFERLSGLSAEFVTCRALDRFEDRLGELIDWSPEASTLLLYGGDSLKDKLAESDVDFYQELLPNSEKRFLFVVHT